MTARKVELLTRICCSEHMGTTGRSPAIVFSKSRPPKEQLPDFVCWGHVDSLDLYVRKLEMRLDDYELNRAFEDIRRDDSTGLRKTLRATLYLLRPILVREGLEELYGQLYKTVDHLVEENDSSYSADDLRDAFIDLVTNEIKKYGMENLVRLSEIESLDDVSYYDSGKYLFITDKHFENLISPLLSVWKSTEIKGMLLDEGILLGSSDGRFSSSMLYRSHDDSEYKRSRMKRLARTYFIK